MVSNLLTATDTVSTLISGSFFLIFGTGLILAISRFSGDSKSRPPY